MEAKKSAGKMLTKEEVVERCNKTHNSRYDYTETKYRGFYKLIMAKCPHHGNFHVTAWRHMNNQEEGCQKCTRDFISREKKISGDVEKFFTEAKEKYGDTMDYSKAVYLRANGKMTIKCNIHNLEFRTTPSNHRKFSGCPECLKLKRQKKHKTEVYTVPKDVFQQRTINRFRFIYGMKYKYDQSVIITNNSMITIGCAEHGDFRLKVIAHLKGEGCPRCEGKKDFKEINDRDKNRIREITKNVLAGSGKN